MATSDLHGSLPDIPDCDILLIAGDICPIENHAVWWQKRWIEETFVPWIRETNKAAKSIVVTPGNHDFVAQDDPDFMRDVLPCFYLQDNGIVIPDGDRGQLVYATPWVNQFGSWAFMAEEDELRLLYDRIPESTRILICHGPPKGFGDEVDSHWQDGNVGSVALLERLKQLPDLKLCVFGHIHEGFGTWKLEETGATLANVSLKDEHYKWARNPVRFNVPQFKSELNWQEV